MNGAQAAARGALALVSVLVIGFTGCAKPGADDARGATTRPAASTMPSGVAAADPNAAPSDPPGGEVFSFDQAARFDDGMLIQVSTIAKATATPSQHGAEGTAGNLVIAEILVTNNTGKPLPTEPIAAYGYYGVVGAPKVVDRSGELGNSFKGTLQPGEQAKARMGFAIPAEELNEVTIMIDGGTPEHGQVQFTGPVLD